MAQVGDESDGDRELRPALDSLVSALADAVVVIDGTGSLVWANRAAEQLFGMSSGSLLGSSALAFVHPEDSGVVSAALASIRGKELGTPIEIRVRTAGGWKLVEIVGSNQLANPTVRGLVLSIRDLTERRRWEVASDETSRFRALVHSSSTVLMLLDRAGHVTSVSAAITRVLGLDQELVEGRLLADLVREADRASLMAALDEALGAPEWKVGTATVEVELKRGTGSGFVPFELNIVNLLDDPTVEGLVVSAHDISRLRESMRQLEAAHEQLVRQERLSALGEMASMIGHELRNPLGAVMNGVFLLRQDLGTLEGEPEQLLTMIERQAEQAIKLAEQITSYMRQRDPELTALALRSVVSEVMDATPPPQGVVLSASVPEMSVVADASQLAQILTNLLTNAYQAMPEGGSVRISASLRGSWHTLVVEDSGKGIDPDVAERILEPFVSSKPYGTGLGLAVVQRLVEAHGGEFTLENRVGGGASATLRLPVRRTAPGPSDAAGAPDARGAGEGTVEGDTDGDAGNPGATSDATGEATSQAASPAGAGSAGSR